MRMRIPLRYAVAAVFAITACSPVFNWREVQLESGGLTALLPCKPDRATRDVLFGEDQVSVQMVGCQAGGATFTIAYAVARDATQAATWLSAWKTTMSTKLQAPTSIEAPVDVGGAAARPAPLELKAEGRDAAGHSVPARVWWFAQAAKSGGPGEVLLYQAMILGQPADVDAATAFFEGLHLL